MKVIFNFIKVNEFCFYTKSYAGKTEFINKFISETVE